jgi:hypothetical protein
MDLVAVVACLTEDELHFLDIVWPEPLEMASHEAIRTIYGIAHGVSVKV